LERDFARFAGLGWFGKNTMLINKRAGSWLFLCAILTDLKLQYDDAHHTSHCGTCQRCLDVCPTDAFPEPYVLDARKCISYLTIEMRDKPIPLELRDGMGNWLFGCDLCQDVCPWNHKAPISNEPEFQPLDQLAPADASSLLKLNDDEFDRQFGQTALARPSRRGLLRNAAIVLGNSKDESARPALTAAITDHEPLIREASAWALGKIGGPAALTALKSRAMVEDNELVLDAINLAIDLLQGINS
jgi:epoxyqueuosine reductase